MLSSAKWSALKTHTGSTIWSEMVIFSNISVYSYIQAITISGKKEAVNLKENREGYEMGFGGRKEKKEILQLYFKEQTKKQPTARSNALSYACSSRSLGVWSRRIT